MAGFSRDHQVAQRIDLIGERIEAGKSLQPAWHEIDGIKRVAGKEEGHGQDLTNAHEAFPFFNEAGHDQGQGGKSGASEQHHGEQGQKSGKLQAQMNAKQVRKKVDDKNLREASDACCKRPSYDKQKSGSRRDQDFVQDPHIPFPNQCDAEKNGEEKDALGQDARRQKIKVGAFGGRDGFGMSDGLAENQEPDGWLNHAREKFVGVMPQLAHVSFNDRTSLLQAPNPDGKSSA